MWESRPTAATTATSRHAVSYYIRRRLSCHVAARRLEGRGVLNAAIVASGALVCEAGAGFRLRGLARGRRLLQAFF